jgi:hypothetical protein
VEDESVFHERLALHVYLTQAVNDAHLKMIFLYVEKADEKD